MVLLLQLVGLLILFVYLFDFEMQSAFFYVEMSFY